ncbi:MAG: periplasmic heavy metal sensor [Acetobacter orientalis]|uniref:Spy/CpxP family protein refolding chaperone n=1 Tax=Acetobacter orientalis TaxID=146474 RepID=UPI0039E7EE06
MKYGNGVLAAAAMVGLSLVALPVMAHPHHGGAPAAGGPGAPVWGGPSMLEGIDLTAQQQKKIDAIVQQAHEQDQTDSIRDDIGRVHRQIQDLLSEPGTLDRTKITALLQQQASLRAQQEARHLDVAEQIHDVLSTEQLTQIKERQAKVRDLMDQLRELQHPTPKAAAQ